MPSLKKVYWNNIRKDIEKVNRPLFEEIDKVSPSKKIPFYVATYRFGHSILQNGVLHVPNSLGELVPITDESLAPSIRHDLNYTLNMPIGVILNKAIELYCETQSQVTPWRIMFPGRIFSLWGALQPLGTSAHTGKMWQITAGARSIIMLPKIEQSRGYKRLQKEFNLALSRPQNYFDEWFLFRDLVNIPEISEETDWHVELVFFSRAWREKLDDPAWMSLNHYLMQSAWLDTSYLRDQVVFDAAFSNALVECNLKPNPYLVDTAKHIYNISRGVLPGFCFATDDMVAPISKLQQIFIEVYGFLKAAPTMMHPSYVSVEESVFYSLAVPTLLLFSPHSKYVDNQLDDLEWIKVIQQKISHYLKADKFGLRDTPIFHLVNSTKYTYIHSSPGQHKGILSAEELTKRNKILMNETKKFGMPFCVNSKFMRGAIEVSKL